MNETKTTKLIKNYIYSLSYQIFVIIVPLITTPYISRALGAENIGIYSYTLSISTYFIVMGNLGFPLYGQREIACNANDRRKYSGIFSEIMFGKMLTLAVALGIYILFVCFAVNEYKEIYVCHIIGIVADIINIGWLYQGLENFRITVVRNFFIKLISIIALFIFVKSPQDLVKYTLIINIANFIGNGLLFINLKKVVDLGKIKFSLKSILRHIKPALILGIPYYITSVYVVIDKTMLGLLCNQYAEVGYYEQSQKIISFSLAIITSLGTVFMPRLANEIAEKNSENVKRFLNYGLEIVLLLAAPLMIGLLCVGNMIVPWFFGSGYDKVGGLLMIFSPLALIMGITNFIGNQYFVASKNEKKLTLTISAGVIINLSLNFLLIPHLASYGAAIATVISEIVKLVMQVCYARDIIAIKELVHKFIQYILCAVIMGCIILMLRWKVFSVFTFSNTMIVMLVGVTVYFVLLLLLKNTFVVTVINKMKSKCLKQ